MGERIYGDKVSIAADEMQAFWCKRASLVKEKGISTVILGDQNAERAQKENEFDQIHIIPQLDITKSDRVIDMGCGVGRFTKMVLPKCGFYCGVDYSGEMVDVTEQVCKQIGEEDPQAGEYKLFRMTFPEAVDKPPEFFGGTFDVYIMLGICMYMNDEQLEYAFKHIPQLLSEKATILFQESMGLKERLTLNQISSDALQTSYSAIYRTKEEYLKLYEPLFQAGFSFVEEAKFPDFGNTYSDSERRFCIMKRS